MSNDDLQHQIFGESIEFGGGEKICGYFGDCAFMEQI